MASPIVSSTIHVGTGKTGIRTWFDDQCHAKIRRSMGIEDSFLEHNVDADALRPGGGKGGQLMAFSACRRYIIKEMSPGDHATLLVVTERYAAHVLSSAATDRGKGTLLCLYLLHYQDIATSKIFVVMANSLARAPLPSLSFGAEKANAAGQQYDFVYDLKGCADDKTLRDRGNTVKIVHKRFWQAHLWLGEVAWSEKRKAYHEGKVGARQFEGHLPEDLYEELYATIERDVEEFLVPCGLMDYSLLVGLRTVALPSDDKEETEEQKENAEDEDASKQLISTTAVMKDVVEFQRKSPLKSLANWQSPFLWTLRVVEENSRGGGEIAKEGNSVAPATNHSASGSEITATTRSASGSEAIILATDEEEDPSQNTQHLLKIMALGVIDLLQDWNVSKRVARLVKIAEHDKATVPPIKYGKRFLERFQQRCRPIPGCVLEYHATDNAAMTKAADKSSIVFEGVEVTQTSSGLDIAMVGLAT